MNTKKAVYPKVAVDSFMAQGVWTLFFLGIIVLVQIIQHVIALNTGNANTSFFVSAHVSSRIYMLVIGIITAYSFLPYYVQNGVTRKDYFKGIALGSFALAIAITLITLLLAGLEHLLVSGLNLPLVLESSSAIELEVEEVFIANLIQTLIVPSPLEASGFSLIGISLATLGKYFYYVVGWMIGSAYYRYNGLVGLGTILLSILLGMVYSSFWGTPVGVFLPFGRLLLSLTLPMATSFLGSVLVIGFILCCIRHLTKRVPIKA